MYKKVNLKIVLRTYDLGANMAVAQPYENKLLKLQVGGETKNLLIVKGNRSVRPFEAYPLLESLNTDNRTSLAVISNLVADVALVTENIGSFAFPVNGAIAYEKPGTKLGKHVVFSDLTAPTVVMATGKYEGAENAALVATNLAASDIAYTVDGRARSLQELLDAKGIDSMLSADFKAVTEIQLLIPHDRLTLVERFPAKNGYHMIHAGTGVTSGADVIKCPEARFIYRTNLTSYVGPIVRYGTQKNQDSLIGVFPASTLFAVVAEVPDKDVEKIESLFGASRVRMASAEISKVLSLFNQEVGSLGYPPTGRG